VEDHRDTAKVMRRILEADGCAVDDCSTIAEAQRLASSKELDLVICDIGLPDGSGLELMRYLRDHYQLKGIALSGFGTQQDVAASKAAGFSMHLVKPVDLMELRTGIAELISPSSTEIAPA
jgi:DNA-binding response OmpR family regulator